MSDDEFVKKLRFVKPSTSYNKHLLKEIEARDIINNVHVYKYLTELQELNICTYEVQCLLLSQFDLSNPINKFVKLKCKYLEIEKGNYKLRNVVLSIKNKKISEDFSKFIDTVESILMSTKQVGRQACTFRINHEAISDFLTLVRKFNRGKYKKKDIVFLEDLKNGFMSFRESWLLVFESKMVVDYILFVFYFLCEDNKSIFKYQILKKMIGEIIGGEDLEIFKDAKERFEESNFVEQYKEFTTGYNTKKFTFKKTPKEKKVYVKASKDVLEWYEARERAFTEAE